MSVARPRRRGDADDPANGPNENYLRWRLVLDRILYLALVARPSLCEICKRLGLTREQFIISGDTLDADGRNADPGELPPTNRGLRQHILGTFGDIRTRSGTCAFCELLLGTLDSSSNPRGDQLSEETRCLLTWQSDGRELSGEHGGSHWTLRTRRILIHWDNPRINDSYIVLMAPQNYQRLNSNPMRPLQAEALYLGRDMSSIGGSPALIRGWIDICHQYHGGFCQNDESYQKYAQEMLTRSFFGVIDVQEMRLTALPPGAQFVALSYTWGSETRYTTTLQNVHMHKDLAGIARIMKKLPKAIRDTIESLPSLGQRYLWVDSLCIVQNSEKSWKLNSSIMDLIYGSAIFTICAADGDDASTGLVGLQSDRNVRQFTKQLDITLRLMVTNNAETYIKDTRWNTRGWTFQERLLSSRCVIFTAGRVYFQCRAASLSEDIIAEQSRPGWSIDLTNAPLQMLRELKYKAFKVYMECVPMYTSRSLHDPEDILAAFTGIGNLLGKELQAPLIFGLPSSHFDLALLWQPTSAAERRKIPDPNKFGDPEIGTFPSWSWCGWKNASIAYRKQTVGCCLDSIRHWLSNHTWISWYIRDGDGDLRPIWSASQLDASASTQLKSWKGYCRDSKMPSLTDHYGRKLPRDISALESSSFTQVLPEYPYRIIVKSGSGHEEGLTNHNRYEQFPRQRYLQFWTWSAILFVRQRGDDPDGTAKEIGPGLERFDIADNKGDWCGTIVLNSDWARGRRTRAQEEFIAISDAREFTYEENPIWTYYIPKEKEESEWDLYNVLLIVKRKGIAQRIGLGKVFKEAFNHSCNSLQEVPSENAKKWKEFIME